MRFIHSLKFRLLVGSVVLLLLLFGLYSYFAIRFHSNQMMDMVLRSANRMSDLIKSSTHYSMLLNRKEDVYETIKMVSKQPGVEGIRIYNKRGVIMFSTDPRETGTTVDLHAEACFACHDKEKPIESLPIDNRMRIYLGGHGYRVLGLINPIRNEAHCSSSGCHVSPSERTVLGVLDLRMSLQEVDAALGDERLKMIGVASVMAVLVAIGSLGFLAVTVHRPVKKLIEATRQLSSGNLGYTIPLDSKDELGELAHSFNEMTKSLQTAEEENTRWAHTLEERVREKTEELRAIHDHILQIEKMTSLGRLSATVAHELNNPLEGILTYAKLLARQMRKSGLLTESQQQMVDDLELIVRETERCGSIVNNLLLFSRKQVSELALVPLKQIIEKAEQLMRHHFEMSNVQFEVSYQSDDAEILCDENQIQQALVALFVNAVEAMPGGGKLRVEETEGESPDVLKLKVSDSGAGIPQEDLPHIFEPFFTTKKEGTGVGLGLSVVYGIVERHGGSISVNSKTPGGTTFTLTFRRSPENGKGVRSQEMSSQGDQSAARRMSNG